MELEFGLAQLVDVGTPAVKALACLEANESTAADVFIFWHAMMQAIKDILTNPRNEFPQHVQHQIFGVLNSRHRRLFEDGNLSNQVYLAATYLDSSRLSLLYHDNDLLSTVSSIPQVRSIQA
jgi:hypothetical protein